jgi:TonB family protein
MRRSEGILTGLALAWAAAAQPAGAQQAAGAGDYAATGAWTIDYATNGCTLSRSFTRGGGTIQLGLSPLTAGVRLKIALRASEAGRLRTANTATVTLDTGTGLEFRYHAEADAAPGWRQAALLGRREMLGVLGTGKRMTIAAGGARFTLRTSGMPAALAALEACEKDLARRWGVDLDRQATAPEPIAPGNWITNDDYPSAALRAGESGTTLFRLSVSAEGKPTGCTVLESSGSTVLDLQTCAVAGRRARFKPATDKAGAAIPGIFAANFIWAMP